DPVELEEAMARVLESEILRLKMREAWLAAAGRLTWEMAARQMMALIEKMGLITRQLALIVDRRPHESAAKLSTPHTLLSALQLRRRRDVSLSPMPRAARRRAPG